MMTILEIWKQKQQRQTPNNKMFVSPVDDNHDFMDPYSGMYSTIDKFLANRYADFFIYNVISDDDVQFFDDAWTAFYHLNKDSFQKIYDGLLEEYNPVENYDKKSEIVTSYTGTEKDELTRTGTEKDELTRTGSEKTENTIAGKEVNKISNPEGGYTDSSTTSISPEDSNSFYNKEKTVAHTDHREDTSETEFINRKDTSESSFTDRKDTSERSFTNRKDTTEKSFNERKDTVVEHTHGNVGVSESSAILQHEIEMRLVNSFYPLIFNRFLKEITIC